MKWVQLNQYAQECKPYRVVVFKVKNSWKYVLYRESERVGVFNSADEAKEKANGITD